MQKTRTTLFRLFCTIISIIVNNDLIHFSWYLVFTIDLVLRRLFNLLKKTQGTNRKNYLLHFWADVSFQLKNPEFSLHQISTQNEKCFKFECGWGYVCLCKIQNACYKYKFLFCQTWNIWAKHNDGCHLKYC